MQHKQIHCTHTWARGGIGGDYPPPETQIYHPPDEALLTLPPKGPKVQKKFGAFGTNLLQTIMFVFPNFLKKQRKTFLRLRRTIQPSFNG